MLSPLSTTGHLIGRPKRRPKLELTLAFLNVGAYALATASLLATL